MQTEDIQRRFSFHPADTDEKKHAHELIRSIHMDAALQLNSLLPEGREKSLVLTNLEQSMFWANAAIARKEGN